jgi:hypothetical protein
MDDPRGDRELERLDRWWRRRWRRIHAPDALRAVRVRVAGGVDGAHLERVDTGLERPGVGRRRARRPVGRVQPAVGDRPEQADAAYRRAERVLVEEAEPPRERPLPRV